MRMVRHLLLGRGRGGGRIPVTWNHDAVMEDTSEVGLVMTEEGSAREAMFAVEGGVWALVWKSVVSWRFEGWIPRV